MSEYRYRGREISAEDTLYIRALIERHPGESRRKLSVRLCEAWQWRQANGALRDMVCRGLLLMLERAGQITLPPVSYVRHNPLSKRARPQPVLIDTTPIEDRLCRLQPLELEQVRRTAQEPLFNSLMEQHHYLGYEQPVGEHLKYLVWAGGRPIACLAWSSAPRHLGSRDRYIGWDAEARRSRIRFIAYNTRFLILPWVRVEHLASHILGRMAARISDDWQQMYGHPIYFLETFIDPERFRGTCYRAANWVLMGRTTGRGKQSNSYVPNRSIKEVLGYPLTKRFRELLGGRGMKKTRRRIEVNLEELDRVLDGARQAPLSEEDHHKLREALHALAAMLVQSRNTEKTSSVVEKPESSEDGEAGKQPDSNAPPTPGHGRNGAEAFSGATRVEIKNQKLMLGDRCPEFGQGNVYAQKEPKALVRVIGQAPLTATVYSLERLRCGACGQVFTAQEPEGVGEDKYDESAAAMIAQLKYGSGTPFYRLEQLQKQMGIPLPAATQWEIVEQAAHPIKAARDELIRQAAQGEVVHNDDTSMRVLRIERDPKDERTGVFTSGIVSTREGRKIALYFTGSQHAGENLADVLKQRSGELLSPIQMCDALSRNVPRLAAGTEILLANCLAHGRRQFVDVTENFPNECRYVLEMLGQVYGHDAEAREHGLTPDQRLRLHQQHSTPIMDELHLWLEAQLAERGTEPNSGLGQAINYLLRAGSP